MSQIIVTACAELLPVSWRLLTYVFGIVPVCLLALSGPCLTKTEETENKLRKDSTAYRLMDRGT